MPDGGHSIPIQFRFLLQVVVPGAAVLAGAALAISALSLASGRLSLSYGFLLLLMFLSGGLLMAAGAFALFARHRHPARAEATSFFLAAGLCGVVAVGNGHLLRDSREPATVKGDLQSVEWDRTRRGPDNLDVRVSGHDETFTWFCGTADCSNGEAIKALHGRRPMLVELQVVGSRIVGLKVDGVHYLDVVRELRSVHSLGLEASIAAMVLAGLCAYLGARTLRQDGSKTRRTEALDR